MLQFLRTERHHYKYSKWVEGNCETWEQYTYRKGKYRRRSPCVAEINLWRGRLGIEVTTHEFFHATMAWGRRVGFDFTRLQEGSMYSMKAEERITYVHGRLCRQFVTKG